MEQCGTVRIRYMGYLAELKGVEEELEICGEKPIQELVNIEGEDIEEFVILVNGRAARATSRVKPGDRIVILPHISGGC